MAERRKSYAEQLKDVRWQKKRLEILEARGWKCEFCKASGNDELHIHHRYYSRKLMAWEYPDWALQVLCASCHEIIQQNLEALHESIAICLQQGVTEDEILGYLHGRLMIKHPKLHKSDASWTAKYLQGISGALRVPTILLSDLVAETGRVTAQDAWDYPFYGEGCCVYGC